MRVTSLARSPFSVAGAKRLAAAVLRAEKGDVAELSITFVGAARMRRLNREYLGHDRVTDVLAFALPALPPSRPPALVGDIYICPAEAAKAAKRFGMTARDEVRRLVVHGLLHVLGYDHPPGERRTDSPMWKRQERHLATLGRG